MDTLQFFEQTIRKANTADGQSAQEPPPKAAGSWGDAGRTHRQAGGSCPYCLAAIEAQPATRANGQDTERTWKGPGPGGDPGGMSIDRLTIS